MREMTLQVESNAKAPSVSRSRVSSMRGSLEPRCDDVLLLVSELVSNSVRHARSCDIDVSVRAENGWIRVEVSDDGPGFTHDAPRGDGLGLSIVDRLADEWGVEPGERFTVWAELSRDLG
jgi:anti-sigma regulatory factor (Ser/Thr protein kinase)